MDVVVKSWLIEVTSSVDITSVCLLLVCFYTDDGLLVAYDRSFLQRASESLCSLFDRVGLHTNTKKTQAMVFLPELIRICLSANAYKVCMYNLYREKQ